MFVPGDKYTAMAFNHKALWMHHAWWHHTHWQACNAICIAVNPSKPSHHYCLDAPDHTHQTMDYHNDCTTLHAPAPTAYIHSMNMHLPLNYMVPSTPQICFNQWPLFLELGQYNVTCMSWHSLTNHPASHLIIAYAPNSNSQPTLPQEIQSSKESHHPQNTRQMHIDAKSANWFWQPRWSTASSITFSQQQQFLACQIHWPAWPTQHHSTSHAILSHDYAWAPPLLHIIIQIGTVPIPVITCPVFPQDHHELQQQMMDQFIKAGSSPWNLNYQLATLCINMTLCGNQNSR